MILKWKALAKKVQSNFSFGKWHTYNLASNKMKEKEALLNGWIEEGEKFCLESSLHGLKYIGQPKRLQIERYP